MRRLSACLLLCSFAVPASAAQSFDACTGFIESVPTLVTTQGVWCLRKDLATAVTSGAAITIAANNVTIDCNGFKLGGLGAGPASQTAGVAATNRLNATVRNCAIRGFHTGVMLGGSGHLVEDNRIDQSLVTAINVAGDNNQVQRNRIFDTGGGEGSPVAIMAEADVNENLVAGVVGSSATTGILLFGQGTEARGNRIRNVMPSQSGSRGIVIAGGEHAVVDNRLLNPTYMGGPPPASTGIQHTGMGASYCRDNLISGYETGITTCEDNGGNVIR